MKQGASGLVGGVGLAEAPSCPDASDAARVRGVIDWLADVDGVGVEDAGRIELIGVLEKVKGAVAAAQARVTVAFDASQRAAHVARGGKGDEVARSVGSQVALARRDSPSWGDRHVGLAKALVGEMPHTMVALTRGEVSEYRASIMVKETACLTVADRALVDDQLAPELSRLGSRSLAAAAKRLAARLDAAAVVARMERAVASRRVSVRPAPDGMAWLTFLAPLADAVGAYAAVTRLADAAMTGTGEDPYGRSHGQVMVDAGIDRIIGRAPGEKVPVEVNLVMTPATLAGDTRLDTGPDSPLGDPDEPGNLPGYGPVPAAWVRRLVRDADIAWVRRLFTGPDGRDLVAMDSRRRFFDGSLRKLLVLRDQTCRTPRRSSPHRHHHSHRDTARLHRPTPPRLGLEPTDPTRGGRVTDTTTTSSTVKDRTGQCQITRNPTAGTSTEGLSIRRVRCRTRAGLRRRTQ